MKGILKIFLGIVIAVFVLMVLAAVLLPVIYDKEDLQNAIADRVSEQTGRELTIDGGLDFSVFPWLAVEVTASVNSMQYAVNPAVMYVRSIRSSARISRSNPRSRLA